MRNLCHEIESLGSRLDADAYDWRGIDIGGGTPTMVSADLLGRLLESLAPWRERCAPHVAFPLSIETTPSIAAGEPEKLAVLRAGGVDRVSMGIQSTNDETLAAVNRTAQIDVGNRAVANLRDAGFDRLSVDLIFALPDQTMDQWKQDLERMPCRGDLELLLLLLMMWVWCCFVTLAGGVDGWTHHRTHVIKVSIALCFVLSPAQAWWSTEPTQLPLTIACTGARGGC